MTISKSTIQYNKAKLYSIADKVRNDPRYKVYKHFLDIIHPKCSNKNNLISIIME